MLALLAAALLAAPPTLLVTLEVKKPLTVKKGLLSGALKVTLKNTGTEPASFAHDDVHGLVLDAESPADGGPAAPSFVLHSCDCAFTLGLAMPPESRKVKLAPGATKELLLDSWDCDGGPYQAPAPGKYRARYRVGPGRSEMSGGNPSKPDLVACAQRLASDSFWADSVMSAPVAMVVGKR